MKAYNAGVEQCLESNLLVGYDVNKRKFPLLLHLAILVLCHFLNTAYADQLTWNKSPKDLFEMIGNPQVDLPDQGSAYENLKDKGSYISGPQATNSIEAAYYLAECYVTGKTGDGGPLFARNKDGFPPNRPESYKLAIPLYESAAEYDHVPSFVKLSAIYADEKYELNDLDKSLMYLIKAAKFGDKASLEKLLPLYSAGFPRVTDEKQKFMGMEVLADSGNPEAQIELSKWLISKESKESFEDAKHFLVPLADKGNVTAIALLKEMENKVNAARAEAQKVAADETSRKETAEKQKVADEQRVAANETLQKQNAEKQKAADEQIAKRKSDKENLLLSLFAIVFLASMVLVVLGIIWGLNEKIIVYNGKSDLVISCIISGITFVATLFAFVSEETQKFSMGLAVLAGFLLIYSTISSYLANQKSIGKTIVVVPTKSVLAGLVVLFSLALIGGVKSGIESSTKASQIEGYSAEERKERRKHKEEATRNFKTAGFAAAVLYPLQKLVRKLVKENPTPS